MINYPISVSRAICPRQVWQLSNFLGNFLWA